MVAHFSIGRLAHFSISIYTTRDEKNSTRARVNVLRKLLIHPQSKEVFDQPEIMEALESCISCKACKSECPSNVDMARFKAEYLQHHYDVTTVPLRSRLIANLTTVQRLGMLMPKVYNMVISNPFTSSVLKKMLKFAPLRSIPRLSAITLRAWAEQQIHETEWTNPDKKVYLFADEFTNYMEVEVGIHFIQLLQFLGYMVIIPEHVESGRTEISKGLLKKAKKNAMKNVALLKDIISEDAPLVGIEPSCILSFRDEYPDLVEPEYKVEALALSQHCLLFDEFIVGEIRKGNILPSQFTDRHLKIMLHGHCHQKSLSSIEPSREMLALPKNYEVEVIPSGCCGMAGSFGYEKEHYELSMKIGEQLLFPAVREADDDVCIVAPGISCRQQIKDGTGKIAYHPIDILYRALIRK